MTAAPQALARPAADGLDRALTDLADGRPVLAVHDDGAADLVLAAVHATAESVSFAIRHSSGFVRVALPGERCDRLGLPPMNGTDAAGTTHRVTVDLRGAGTGISGRDRAATIAALGSPDSVAGDFVRPGHVVPVAAWAGGTPGPAEAAHDLARLAGAGPAGVFCELMSTVRPGDVARDAEVRRFAAEHDLAVVGIGSLPGLGAAGPRIRQVGAPVPVHPFDDLRFVTFTDDTDGGRHLAVLRGSVPAPVTVRHGCTAGLLLGADACGCRSGFDSALGALRARGSGALILLTGAARCAGRRPTGGAGTGGPSATDEDAGTRGDRGRALHADRPDRDAVIVAAIRRELGIAPGSSDGPRAAPGDPAGPAVP